MPVHHSSFREECVGAHLRRGGIRGGHNGIMRRGTSGVGGEKTRGIGVRKSISNKSVRRAAQYEISRSGNLRRARLPLESVATIGMSPIRVQRRGRPSIPEIESEHGRGLIKCAAWGWICQEQPLSAMNVVDLLAVVEQVRGRRRPLLTRARACERPRPPELLARILIIV
eukprot:6213935-Pleurochrysis_carterae.AAC.2